MANAAPDRGTTGPRTAEGKVMVSRNAFKGGKRALLRRRRIQSPSLVPGAPSEQGIAIGKVSVKVRAAN